jgi:hypothetical protein
MDPTNPLSFGPHKRRQDKNPYRPRQVMDGDVLIGTYERDHTSGAWATLASTEEQKWFSTSSMAHQWLLDQRSDSQHQDRLETSFSFRHQWDYVD